MKISGIGSLTTKGLSIVEYVKTNAKALNFGNFVVSDMQISVANLVNSSYSPYNEMTQEELLAAIVAANKIYYESAVSGGDEYVVQNDSTILPVLLTIESNEITEDIDIYTIFVLVQDESQQKVVVASSAGYTVGDSVSTPSGGLGVVRHIFSAENTLYIEVSAGTFLNGEALTNVTAGGSSLISGDSEDAYYVLHKSCPAIEEAVDIRVDDSTNIDAVTNKYIINDGSPVANSATALVTAVNGNVLTVKKLKTFSFLAGANIDTGTVYDYTLVNGGLTYAASEAVIQVDEEINYAECTVLPQSYVSDGGRMVWTLQLRSYSGFPTSLTFINTSINEIEEHNIDETSHADMRDPLDQYVNSQRILEQDFTIVNGAAISDLGPYHAKPAILYRDSSGDLQSRIIPMEHAGKTANIDMTTANIVDICDILVDGDEGSEQYRIHVLFTTATALYVTTLEIDNDASAGGITPADFLANAVSVKVLGGTVTFIDAKLFHGGGLDGLTTDNDIGIVYAYNDSAVGPARDYVYLAKCSLVSNIVNTVTTVNASNCIVSGGVSENIDEIFVQHWHQGDFDADGDLVANGRMLPVLFLMHNNSSEIFVRSLTAFPQNGTVDYGDFLTPDMSVTPVGIIGTKIWEKTVNPGYYDVIGIDAVGFPYIDTTEGTFVMTVAFEYDNTVDVYMETDVVVCSISGADLDHTVKETIIAALFYDNTTTAIDKSFFLTRLSPNTNPTTAYLVSNVNDVIDLNLYSLTMHGEKPAAMMVNLYNFYIKDIKTLVKQWPPTIGNNHTWIDAQFQSKTGQLVMTRRFDDGVSTYYRQYIFDINSKNNLGKLLDIRDELSCATATTFDFYFCAPLFSNNVVLYVENGVVDEIKIHTNLIPELGELDGWKGDGSSSTVDTMWLFQRGGVVPISAVTDALPNEPVWMNQYGWILNNSFQDPQKTMKIGRYLANNYMRIEEIGD